MLYIYTYVCVYICLRLPPLYNFFLSYCVFSYIYLLQPIKQIWGHFMIKETKKSQTLQLDIGKMSPLFAYM